MIVVVISITITIISVNLYLHRSAYSGMTGSSASCRQTLPKAEQQPAMTAVQDPNRPTPPGVVVVPITAPQPHTDTTALFQSNGLIRNKAALTAIGDSCGCMEYGFTRCAKNPTSQHWTKPVSALGLVNRFPAMMHWPNLVAKQLNETEQFLLHFHIGLLGCGQALCHKTCI